MPKLHRIYSQSEFLESEEVLFVTLNFDKKFIIEHYAIEKVGKKNIMFEERTPLGKSVPVTSVGFVYPIETNKDGEFKIFGTCLPKDKEMLSDDFIELLHEKRNELMSELNACINITKNNLIDNPLKRFNRLPEPI